jgi:hypothetical protein
MFPDNPIGSPVRLCRSQRPAHWIEIVLQDDEGRPVPGEEYLVTLPDSMVVRGYLDDAGFAHLEPIDPGGTCKVNFPNLDSNGWKYQRSE